MRVRARSELTTLREIRRPPNFSPFRQSIQVFEDASPLSIRSRRSCQGEPRKQHRRSLAIRSLLPWPTCLRQIRSRGIRRLSCFARGRCGKGWQGSPLDQLAYTRFDNTSPCERSRINIPTCGFNLSPVPPPYQDSKHQAN